MLNALPTNDWRLAMIAADGYYSENEANFLYFLVMIL